MTIFFPFPSHRLYTSTIRQPYIDRLSKRPMACPSALHKVETIRLVLFLMRTKKVFPTSSRRSLASKIDRSDISIRAYRTISSRHNLKLVYIQQTGKRLPKVSSSILDPDIIQVGEKIVNHVQGQEISPDKTKCNNLYFDIL